MYIAAIIPAAGYGSRLKNIVPKPLIKIEGIPIIIHTLKAITQHPLIQEVIVVANKSNLRIIKYNIDKYHIKRINNIVLGGKTRRLSVENALRALKEKVDFVLIHDAVRPLIEQNVISKVIDEASNYGAAVVGVPVKATIKKVKSQKSKVKSKLMIEKTLDRSGLWEIQTPQVFRKDIILNAYNRFNDNSATDDASLVERLGLRIKVVKGSYFNIKITTPEDLILAEAILKSKNLKLKPRYKVSSCYKETW